MVQLTKEAFLKSNENIVLEDMAVIKPLAIIYRDPGSLIPDQENPRHHPETQIKQLMNSIKKYDFNGVVLTDAGGNIISGHALVLAALRLKLEAIPTIVIDHL